MVVLFSILQLLIQVDKFFSDHIVFLIVDIKLPVPYIFIITGNSEKLLVPGCLAYLHEIIEIGTVYSIPDQILFRKTTQQTQEMQSYSKPVIAGADCLIDLFLVVDRKNIFSFFLHLRFCNGPAFTEDANIAVGKINDKESNKPCNDQYPQKVLPCSRTAAPPTASL